MVRKGWTHMEVPDGGLQVLRGPRPKAEKWPHQSVRNSSAAQMPGKPQLRERWRNGVAQTQHSAAKALESALAALDPEDGNARAGIEAALKRVKDQAQAATQANRAQVPEAMFEAARVRVSKLEAAIEAMGEFQGPEVQYLQGALARARVAATPPPVDVQLTQCQQFIDRATKRIEDLDRAREMESIRLKEAQGRLHRLQQETESANSGTNDIGVEVAILKAKLAKTEAERDALRAPPPRSKVRRTEDAGGCSGRVIPFMPTLVSEELDDWMKDRQADLQEALEFGETDRVLELTSKLSEAAVRMMEMAGKDGPVIEGTSLALFHVRRQAREVN